MSPLGRRERPLLFATVGTDHHQFDRLVGWVDTWAAQHRDIDCVVQHGTSAEPVHARGVQYLPKAEQDAMMQRAFAVVCHGGPATMADVRRAGRVAIVVPREGQFGEHVDDHQVRFSRHIAGTGLGRVVASERELHALLDGDLVGPELGTVMTGEIAGVAPAAHVGQLVEDLIDSDETPTVLYIAGFGRSGSTLIDRMLGQVPGAVSVGELVFLWERGLRDDQRCGCGEQFWRCAFWSEVGRVAFGGWAAVDLTRALELKRKVDRNRHLPMLVAPGASPIYRQVLDDWTSNFLAPLYAAVAKVSGASVVVDSSKHVSYGFLLRRVPGINLRVLQAVRDPRGVAWSWAKQVERPEVADSDGRWMPRYSAAVSTSWWLYDNSMLRMLPALGVRTEVIRYEDLVRRPAEVIRRAFDLTGLRLAPCALDFIDGDTVELGVGHSVAGNPMRFTQGRLSLRADEGWREGLGTKDRLVVEGIAALCPSPAVRYPRTSRCAVPAFTHPVARPDTLVISEPGVEFDGPWPSVSAIVATRDRPELLRRALDAIVAQDYDGDLEILLVFDQEEPDFTLATTRRGRLIRVTANGRSLGLAGARNSGIGATTGTLVAFCDDDDEWLPGKLRAQVVLLASNPGAAVASSGIEVVYGSHRSERVPVRATTTYEDLLESRVSWLHPSTILVRRDALLGPIGLVDEEVPGGYGEDYEWLLRAARHAPILVAPNCLTRVHWHPQSFFASRWTTIIAALTWLLERYPDFARVPRGRARILGQIAFAQAALGERRLAAKTAQRALRDDWREPRAALALAVAAGIISHEWVLRQLHRRGKGI